MLAFMRFLSLKSSLIRLSLGVAACCALSAQARAADIEIIDDNGRAVLLTKPASRVVTLTPHVTELVFEAGAGSKIVATVAASDFPPEARTLPRIGDGLAPDPEKVAALKPDLIIGWLPEQTVALDALNVPIFISSPQTLADIPDSVETFGVMLGTAEVARARADALRNKLESLTSHSSKRPLVRVFVQAGAESEYSLGGDHILSDVIALCGGVNVFAESTALAPKISIESVIAAKPDLVLVGKVGAPAIPTPDTQALAYWKVAGLPAARPGHVQMMDADVLYRPGPRLIDAATRICDLIEQARK